MLGESDCTECIVSNASESSESSIFAAYDCFSSVLGKCVERSKSEVKNSPATDVPRYSQPEMRGSSSVTRSLALVVKLLDRLEALLFTMPTAPRFIVTKSLQNQSINATGPSPLPVSQGRFGLPADGTLTVPTGLIACCASNRGA